jgi:hypothetical protein
MSDLIERLKARGWTDTDIQKAINIIEQGKAKKPKNILFLDSIVYWLVLFVALIGNFIISVILIPFMLIVEGLRLFVIITLIGFAFGAFFDLLIRDLRNIENKEVIIAGVFLPLLALINVSLMVEFSNYLHDKLGLLTNYQNPFAVGFVYVFAFILPYLFKVFMRHFNKNKVMQNFKYGLKPTG